ncbi:hypothetical protein O1611_g10503 [Lasiodiplodia mahajangana]|uniref:Uncharacterized protein n=1 Tax=Lasiodiplodia mahajangana TaxID=1108764 RepID=A0ACC2IXM3_9PEZI|nr:hypothetical protein O1611_g10503 [Lasiodiplodia mahajangana]
MPMFEEADFGVEAPLSPTQLEVPYDNMSVGSHEHRTLPIPGDHGEGPIEIPATRSSISEAAKYMHNLSVSPSQKDRRGSRNSFGASLPIPRSKRRSRLSSSHAVDDADGHLTRPGMPPIQPTREILASQIQTIEAEKVKKAKNMAFAFDIDAGARDSKRRQRARHEDPTHLPDERKRQARTGTLRPALQDPTKPRQH